jgi:hypothetical protein
MPPEFYDCRHQQVLKSEQFVFSLGSDFTSSGWIHRNSKPDDSQQMPLEF